MDHRNAWAKQGSTVVNGATYNPVLYSDTVLDVTRTSSGACSITFPAITAQLDKKIFIVFDAGYNAGTNNITLIPTGSDKINGVTGNFIINISGLTCLMRANFATLNWETWCGYPSSGFGPIEFMIDAGPVSLASMLTSATPAAGTEMSIAIAIAYQNFIKFFAETTGTANLLRNEAVIFGKPLAFPTTEVQLLSAGTNIVLTSATATNSSRVRIAGNGTPVTLTNNPPIEPHTLAAEVVYSADKDTDTITKAAHGLVDGDRVIISRLGTITNVDTVTAYYVRDSAASTFKLALTFGGVAIDLTGANEADFRLKKVTGTIRDGELVILECTSNTNYVVLNSSSRFSLLSTCVLGQGDMLAVMYNAWDDVWYEVGRKRLRAGAVDLNASTYTVSFINQGQVIQCRYTGTGTVAITLPAIANVGNGFSFTLKDSGYNAGVNNITLTPNGAEKVENVAAPYVINVSGTSLTFCVNSVTSNWEII